MIYFVLNTNQTNEKWEGVSITLTKLHFKFLMNDNIYIKKKERKKDP